MSKRLATEQRLTPEKLEAIRKRAEAASEGPWELDGDDGGIWNNGGFNYLGSARSFYDDDANFIAHSREDIPVLLAEVERLRKLMADIRECSDIETAVAELADIGLGGDTE